VSTLTLKAYARIEALDLTAVESLAGVLPHEPKPDTQSLGSSVLVAANAALMAVNQWTLFLNKFESVPNFVKGELHTYWKPGEIVAWEHPPASEPTPPK